MGVPQSSPASKVSSVEKYSGTVLSIRPLPTASPSGRSVPLPPFPGPPPS
ncbi:hypothetical protein AB0E63_42510 [Kribbella sp. NPDC026596]